MSTFVFTYRRSGGYRTDARDAWRAWFDGLGGRVVQVGNPVTESGTLGDCGPDTRLGGFSLIDAEDLDAALALAKDCPGVLNGGGVEVGQLVDVP